MAAPISKKTIIASVLGLVLLVAIAKSWSSDGMEELHLAVEGVEAASGTVKRLFDVRELHAQSRSNAFIKRSVANLNSDLAGLIKNMASKGNVVTFDCNATLWWTPDFIELKKLKNIVCVDFSCDFQSEERGSIFRRDNIFFSCPRESTAGGRKATNSSGLLDVAGAIVLAPGGKLSYKQMGLINMVQSVPTVIKVMLAADGAVSRTVVFDRTAGQCAPTHVTVAGLASNAFTEVFSKIYDTNQWGVGGGGGEGSGSGSNMEQTAVIRAELPPLLVKYGIRSMVDSSCGSFHWMPLVLEDVRKSIKGFKYAGLDVACKVIEGHKAKYASEAWMRFECLDTTSMPLPKNYDAIFSRDALQHLPLAAVYNYLHNVKASGAKYLLVGSYLSSPTQNIDIAAGDVNYIDVTKPPFNMRPKPLAIINETTSEDRKYLLLYEVQNMVWDVEL